MWIRDARPEDAAALAAVFWRAVREGPSPYSEPARAAWVPHRPSAEEFARRLEGLETVVAEAEEINGFMAMDAEGCLELAYVLPAQRRQGVADRLYLVLESRARARRLPALTARASRMARGFLARHGWQVVAPDPVIRGGVVLDRDAMRKALPPRHRATARAAGPAAGIFENPCPHRAGAAR
jgi:putative acetyltransferase